MRIIISFLLLAGSASAESPAESLQALIQHAYKNSPEIKAARARWQAAIERYPQATSLPDPMLAYG
ncbi:MAG: TolC family protein, partial [Planctomycetota bacterium]|nr:TolC family protein [Planctomycetota bacterium]